MPTILSNTSRLVSRDINNGSTWALSTRWVFFVILLVAIVVCVLGTIKANKRRASRGVLPIYGTRWMTPPSYLQSQGQYNQPTRGDAETPNAYVPTYTERANDNDMGYYAPDGTFHPNPYTKGPEFPENIHQRSTYNTDGHPIQDFNQSAPIVHDEGDDNNNFTRPAGPPPSSSTFHNGSNESTEGAYTRPDHPPPGR